MFDASGADLLLVEAESVLAELTSFRLELLGYRIRHVASGASAMEAIATRLPELLIADTTLPDCDGVEFVTRVRSEWSAEQLPILIFSIDPTLDTVERAFVAGAQDYLVTPFDPTVLEAKIQGLLDRGHASLRRR